MSIAFIAIGSNLGNRELHLSNAIDLIQNKMTILKKSQIIETNPIGGPPQRKYLNSVIKVQTDSDPKNLLTTLQKIEQTLGRIRKEKNGPRTIDLDILLYDNIKLNDENLIIPHPRMIEREFVLKPLKEIEPEILKNVNI